MKDLIQGIIGISVIGSLIVSPILMCIALYYGVTAKDFDKAFEWLIWGIALVAYVKIVCIVMMTIEKK